MKVLTVIAAAVLATALAGTSPAEAHGKPRHDKCKRDSVGVLMCCRQVGKNMHCRPGRALTVKCFTVMSSGGALWLCYRSDGSYYYTPRTSQYPPVWHVYA